MIAISDMAKSEEIPIVTPNRDYDNPFNDQTAFSPPNVSIFDKRAELVDGRERSASQPTPTRLSGLVSPPFSPHEPTLLRSESERGNSNPNLATSKFATPPMHPLDRMHSTPLRDAVEAEGLRGFHSAPVTPCQTPLGSRQGSPKAERRKPGGGLLGAIFGAGIYGRQTSDGQKPGLLGHLAEDNEDDLTPVGSPGGFTIDELKTRLRGADDDHIGASPVSKEGVGGGGGIVAPTAAANANVFIKKKQSDHEYSYAELNIIAPSSM